MESLESIQTRIVASFPQAKVSVLPNGCPLGEASLIIDPAFAVDIAQWLRDDSSLKLDFLSNVTGVDWIDKEIKTKIKQTDPATGEVKEVEQVTQQPGCLEAVYHLYSVALRHGPVVIRMRTENRTDKLTLPSLTPVWRSAELQEREVFDLYGIIFKGHPDLRRILMWDDFEGHPMRKDYIEPDDYEYEPTAHDKVLERSKKHFPTTSAEASS